MKTHGIQPNPGVSRESANSVVTLLDPLAQAMGKEMFDALAGDADRSTRREIMSRARPVIGAIKAARGSSLPTDVARALLPENARRV